MDTNKNKMGYIIFTIVRLCILSGICLWGIVVIKDRIFIEKEVTESTEDIDLLINSDYPQSPNHFFAKDLAVLEMKDNFRLEDYYITNKVTGVNHYYIDKDQVLWGYGRNEYGQLGNGSVDDLEVFYEEPVKIAENVVSVDASCNGYFCIYLTAEGELYGMGSNMLGLLGQEYYTGTYLDVNVTEPVLLMDGVVYARAGREAIVTLDKEGNVWWWGQYRTSYSTKYQDKASDLYWKITEDEKNPVKMLSIHPNKILENCIYVATGDTTGAAIGENGELYTWGLNIFGECGTEVTGDDFVRTPEKVLENVNMVWVEKIAFGDTAQEIPERADYSACYDFNLFVQLKDGQVLAAGKGIGGKEKGIELTGDIEYTTSYVYSDQFVPVETESYSEPEVRKKLGMLTWGMGMAEAEKLLTKEGVRCSYVEGGNVITVETSSYILYFDKRQRLNRIYLQEGGSRDGQFRKGMSMEEVCALFGSELVYEEDGEDSGIYWAQEAVNGNRLGFIFENDFLWSVFEEPYE